MHRIASPYFHGLSLIHPWNDLMASVERTQRASPHTPACLSMDALCFLLPVSTRYALFSFCAYEKADHEVFCVEY